MTRDLPGSKCSLKHQGHRHPAASIVNIFDPMPIENAFCFDCALAVLLSGGAMQLKISVLSSLRGLKSKSHSSVNNSHIPPRKNLALISSSAFIVIHMCSTVTTAAKFGVCKIEQTTTAF